jgi:hypothetical protein
MASVHISEIQQWLASNGQGDASSNSREFFLEIRFDEGADGPLADEDLANEVITAFCPQGTATIVFDSGGNLRSIDIS